MIFGEENMKRILVGLLIMLFAWNVVAIAEGNTYKLPLDFEFGMDYETLSIALGHYSGGYYKTSMNSFEFTNVTAENPSISARMNLCVVPDATPNPNALSSMNGKFFDTLTRVLIEFCVDGSGSIADDRSAEYELVENFLTEKYGETSFKRDMATGETYVLLPTVTASESVLQMSQRIVPYENGGYVVLTHVQRKPSRHYLHEVEVYYVGDDLIFTDNQPHMPELNLSLDDIL